MIVMEGDLIYTQTGTIYAGWVDIYTVPAGKKYILHGAWANRWSGAYNPQDIKVIDAVPQDYYLNTSDSITDVRINIQLNKPILMLAGWKVQFFKYGAAAGTGSCGCYGLELNA